MNNQRKKVNYQEVGIALIAGMVIIFISYYASNVSLFDEQHHQQELLFSKIEKLRAENDELDRVHNNFTRLSLESSKLQEKYDELKSLIPEEKDVTQILDWVAADARGRNLKLEHFSQNTRINKGELIEIPLIVSVHGDIDQMRRFTEDMARYERLLRVDNIKIEGKLPSTQPLITQSTDPSQPIKVVLQSDGVIDATLNISAFIGNKLSEKTTNK